jgi:hypothetical protein
MSKKNKPTPPTATNPVPAPAIDTNPAPVTATPAPRGPIVVGAITDAVPYERPRVSGAELPFGALAVGQSFPVTGMTIAAVRSQATNAGKKLNTRFAASESKSEPGVIRVWRQPGAFVSKPKAPRAASAAAVEPTPAEYGGHSLGGPKSGEPYTAPDRK